MKILLTMNDTYEKIVLIIVGWLLGLLGPAIVDSIRKRREAREAKTAIWTELQELQFRLVSTVSQLEMRYGNANKEFLAWLKSVLEKYRGINSTEVMLKTIESSESLTEEELAQGAHLL